MTWQNWLSRASGLQQRISTSGMAETVAKALAHHIYAVYVMDSVRTLL